MTEKKRHVNLKARNLKSGFNCTCTCKSKRKLCNSKQKIFNFYN